MEGSLEQREEGEGTLSDTSSQISEDSLNPGDADVSRRSGELSPLDSISPANSDNDDGDDDDDSLDLNSQESAGRLVEDFPHHQGVGGGGRPQNGREADRLCCQGDGDSCVLSSEWVGSPPKEDVPDVKHGSRSVLDPPSVCGRGLCGRGAGDSCVMSSEAGFCQEEDATLKTGSYRDSPSVCGPGLCEDAFGCLVPPLGLLHLCGDSGQCLETPLQCCQVDDDLHPDWCENGHGCLESPLQCSQVDDDLHPGWCEDGHGCLETPLQCSQVDDDLHPGWCDLDRHGSPEPALQCSPGDQLHPGLCTNRGCLQPPLQCSPGDQLPECEDPRGFLAPPLRSSHVSLEMPPPGGQTNHVQEDSSAPVESEEVDDHDFDSLESRDEGGGVNHHGDLDVEGDVRQSLSAVLEISGSTGRESCSEKGSGKTMRCTPGTGLETRPVFPESSKPDLPYMTQNVNNQSGGETRPVFPESFKPDLPYMTQNVNNQRGVETHPVFAESFKPTGNYMAQNASSQSGAVESRSVFPTRGENKPARVKNMPAPVENTPTCAGNTPALGEITSACVENMPAYVDNTPAYVENTLTRMDNINMPACVENTPSHVENTPTHVENTLTHVENTPIPFENTLNSSDSVGLKVEDSAVNAHNVKPQNNTADERCTAWNDELTRRKRAKLDGDCVDVRMKSGLAHQAQLDGDCVDVKTKSSLAHQAHTTDPPSELGDAMDQSMTDKAAEGFEAKLNASISWILCKAYGKNVPSELRDPFYEDAKGQLQVKPLLVNLLTSSDLYCQACSNMFSDTSSQWHGHWSIIQVLSRKGIYVAEDGDTIVTETVLMHTAPFKVAAHLALIDALMKAYISEIASVEHIVQAVRRYSNFSASSELPGNWEEALVFWVNKTCAALAARGDLEIIQGESQQKVRIVSRTPRQPRSVAVLTDLMGDLGDGCCLAAAITFYQPEAFPVADVCLNENVGIADSLYNLRLIRTFCERHLAAKCFHFTYEDLLYGKENLRENVLCFMAELFSLLEAAQQGSSKKDAALEGGVPVLTRHLSNPSIPPVSSATKRSFQKAADDSRHHLLVEKISACPPVLSSRQPLLQKRGTRRSQSLSSPQERDVIRRSVLAWHDDQDIRDRSSHNSALLENVSMSWGTNDDSDTTIDLDPVSSADLAEFEVTGRPQSHRRTNLMDPTHPEFMEVLSVTPGGQTPSTRASVSSGPNEPLMPAKLRPAKEKANHHSKAQERGDRTRTPRKKAVVSPTARPSKGKLSPTPPGSGGPGRTSPGGKGSSSSLRSSGSDETVVTPLASADLATGLSDEIVTSSSESSAVTQTQQQQQQQQQEHLQQQQQQQQQQQRRPVSRSGYEAFVIGPDSSEMSLCFSPRKTAGGLGTHEDRPPTVVSYTLESGIHDSQIAREAGLPVIVQTVAGGDAAVARQCSRATREGSLGASREGSVGSSRSSGDFSDHESHKIHQDHKARESLKHSPRQGGVAGVAGVGGAVTGQGQKLCTTPRSSEHPESSAPKAGQLITSHLPAEELARKAGTTSFAEIRRLKGLGRVDNSGLVYMQQGQEDGGEVAGEGQVKVGTKSTLGPNPDGKGSRVGGTPPRETTWQQNAQRQAAQAASSAESNSGDLDPPAKPELSQLRLKLEEKRREIERKKQRREVQTAKMRQRLGKAAFMRVILKKDEGEGGREAEEIPVSWRRGGGDASSSSSSSGGKFSIPKFSAPTRDLLQERLGQAASVGEPSTRPTSLATISPSSSNSTSAAHSPAGGKFPREGSRPGDDSNVRRHWFHGSDPEGEIINSILDDDDEGGSVADVSSNMMQSCPPSVAAEAFGYASRPLGRELSVEREVVFGAGGGDEEDRNQTPRNGRRSEEEEEEYDQSLDKLNQNLSGLQSEIRRLSLQEKEQFGASSPTPTPTPTPQSGSGSLRDQTPTSRPASNLQHSRRGTAAPSPANLNPASLTPDVEMQKKKDRLMQQQMKRKEEQERKRLHKELETQRRQEKKMLKEEVQEKKKAEEKARREAIFQQYLQKKTDDSPTTNTTPNTAPNTAASTVTRRERTGGGGQPRPKSMFAKSRPGLTEMADNASASASKSRRGGGVPSHSSQEDLSAHTSPTGSTVSCNQLTQNGGQGASTYRRPVSPGQLSSLPLERKMDSGSEAGSFCGSSASEYAGPKLFVKPSAKSNRHIIINALSYCCLAGIVNTDMKNKVLEEIARSAAKHFLILFRDHSCQYRGLYSFDPDTEEAYKIAGIGPRQLSSGMVEHFYKYNSGGKSFNAVTSTKHLSVSIDAVVIQNVFWKSKAPATARR
ncbi:hypothetical protein ACOMHN_014924 [Nucella lapillus]